MSSGEIEDLQCRIAHQELTIEALNETVVRQQQQLDALRDELAQVKGMVRDLRPSPLDGPVDHELPPHY